MSAWRQCWHTAAAPGSGTPTTAHSVTSWGKGTEVRASPVQVGSITEHPADLKLKTWRRARQHSRRTQSSPPTMNTSKIHLREEQFPLKANWRLAERPLCNQGCEKDPYGLRKEGKKSDHVGAHAPGRGHRRGGGLHGLGVPPWEVSGSNHILGHPSLEDPHQENESPWLV